jgi:hypothetical protein
MLLLVFTHILTKCTAQEAKVTDLLTVWEILRVYKSTAIAANTMKVCGDVLAYLFVIVRFFSRWR